MKVNLHTSKMQCFWSGFGIQIVNGKLSRNVKKAFEKGTRRGRPEAKAKRNAVPKFSIRWIRKRAHPWHNEEPSKRQCLKGDEMENQGAVPSQGVVPHESAVLSNGVVPSESAVLNAAPSESLELPSESAVPSGTAAVPPSSDVAAPASESGAPGASGNRITKHKMSPKEFFYSSMDAEIGSATLSIFIVSKGPSVWIHTPKPDIHWIKRTATPIHCKCPRRLSTCLARVPWKKPAPELGTGGTLSKSKLNGKYQIQGPNPRVHSWWFHGSTSCVPNLASQNLFATASAQSNRHDSNYHESYHIPRPFAQSKQVAAAACTNK